MVYRETTNPPVATGDGMAAAYRAGAELRDMEFMQFHPTVLYVAGSARFLISEAVRGEGAYLRDVHGERFMLEDDPRAELAPRDVVVAGHLPHDGADAAPQRLPRPVAPRPGDGPASASPASARSAGASAWTSPTTASRSGPGPLHGRRRDGRPAAAARRCRACGRPAR